MPIFCLAGLGLPSKKSPRRVGSGFLPGTRAGAEPGVFMFADVFRGVTFVFLGVDGFLAAAAVGVRGVFEGLRGVVFGFFVLGVVGGGSSEASGGLAILCLLLCVL